MFNVMDAQFLVYGKQERAAWFFKIRNSAKQTEIQSQDSGLGKTQLIFKLCNHPVGPSSRDPHVP